MASLEIRQVKSDDEYRDIFAVLSELRSTPTFEQVLSLCREAEKRDEFRFVGAYEDNQCIAVMGFRILYDLTHGKHLYIDDLVVRNSHRSRGIGAQMIAYANERAVENDCVALRLCTGVDNTGAQKFYERLEWTRRSYAFKKFLKPWTRQ